MEEEEGEMRASRGSLTVPVGQTTHHMPLKGGGGGG